MTDGSDVWGRGQIRGGGVRFVREGSDVRTRGGRSVGEGPDVCAGVGEGPGVWVGGARSVGGRGQVCGSLYRWL